MQWDTEPFVLGLGEALLWARGPQQGKESYSKYSGHPSVTSYRPRDTSLPIPHTPPWPPKKIRVTTNQVTICFFSKWVVWFVGFFGGGVWCVFWWVFLLLFLGWFFFWGWGGWIGGVLFSSNVLVLYKLSVPIPGQSTTNCYELHQEKTVINKRKTWIA